MNREKGFNVELQNYANNNSLRFNPYQRELIDYTMKYGKLKCLFFPSNFWSEVNE